MFVIIVFIGTVIFQRTEHGKVTHVVPVDDQVVRIRRLQSAVLTHVIERTAVVQKDRARLGILFLHIPVEIVLISRLIVQMVQHRIIHFGIRNRDPAVDL